ncbi:MAG: hypothetical protein WCC04_17430 [Terriglobales bacterium]
MAEYYYEDTDWRELCREASEEQDPRRLLELLREINETLAAERSRAAQRYSA